MNKFSLILIFLTFFVISSSSVFAASVSINEILPHPSSGNDWIELYKPGTEEVDMSGWKIEDSTGVVETFADGTKFASSSSFMQFLVSNRLNNGGDSIKLKDKDGVLIDEKSYSQDPGVDISLGRYPDGSSSWGVLTSASPNGPNSDFVPTPTPIPTSIPTPTSIPKPTNTPVPSAASQPQNSPTSKVLPTSIKTPTKTASSNSKTNFESISGGVTQEGSILGESDSGATDSIKEATQANTNKKLSFPLVILLLGGGGGCIVAAVVLSSRKIGRSN